MPHGKIRKRKPISKPRYTLMYSRKRDDVRVYGGEKYLYSLIDVIFYGRGFFWGGGKPSQEVLNRIYRLGGDNRRSEARGKYRYNPSISYKAYLRLLRIREMKLLRNKKLREIN